MQPKSLRLLFVIKSLAVDGGGAERVLSAITSGLAARGHQIEIATFDTAASKPFYRFDERVKLIRLGVGRSDRESSPVEVWARVRALRSLARDRRPDVAVGFMHSAYVPLALALAGTDLASIGSEHIVFGHYADRPVERMLLLAAGYLLTATTGISETMREGFPASYRRKMHVIVNPVALPETAGASHVSRENVVLTVGRLEEQKDQATLILAFNRIAREFSPWRLRIIGEGSLRPELEALARRAGLSDRIELPGTVHDIEREYARAGLFVMPSRYESFGLATAEALAAGLQALGFADCPGTNELIKNGVNGLLVSGQDRAEALADGLARLIGDAELRTRLGQAGPASVAGYSVDAVVNEWEALFAQVAARNGSRL